MLAVVETMDVALFGITILVVVLVLFGLCVYGFWLRLKSDSTSPYSRTPLRRAEEISYYAKEQILRYLYYLHQYDNRIFEFRKAAVCRETGRIFPNAITWYNKIELDWSFLPKRYPGKYVSWGSLTTDQKEIIRDAHASLDGYQTQFSSPEILPRAIEAKYAFTKPGPLYVDIDTKILLGWKVVPGTDFEVLIVQKPQERPWGS